MKDKTQNCSRRDFLKTAGAAGMGAMVGPSILSAAGKEQNNRMPDNMIVPTRPFGKTGKQVATLSLGGMFDMPRAIRRIGSR